MAYIMAKNVKIILDRLVSQAREIERLTVALDAEKTDSADYYRWWQEVVKEKDAANIELETLKGRIEVLPGMNADTYKEFVESISKIGKHE